MTNWVPNLSICLQKALEGVKVRVLYDEMGSRRIKKRPLINLKMPAARLKSFPIKIPLVNLRINFRNHRKIVVIDGRLVILADLMLGTNI